jgi:hypothetical protein
MGKATILPKTGIRDSGSCDKRPLESPKSVFGPAVHRRQVKHVDFWPTVLAKSEGAGAS